jgi:hypothetical protein
MSSKNYYIPVKFGGNKTSTWDMDLLRTQVGILSDRLTEWEAELDEDREDIDQLLALLDALDDEVHSYFMRVDDEEDV